MHRVTVVEEMGLGMEPRASHVLSIHPTTELASQPPQQQSSKTPTVYLKSREKRRRGILLPSRVWFKVQQAMGSASVQSTELRWKTGLL